MIMAKVKIGYKVTHNGDGQYLRCWRLHQDGLVERTTPRGYREWIDSEIIPQEILDAAEEHGISIKPGRPEWRQGKIRG